MRRRFKTPIALFVAALVMQVPGCGGSSPAPPSVRHFFLYQSNGWKGVLVLNGIPVQLLLNPQPELIPITEWVQTGKNEVGVIVQVDENTQGPFQFGIFSGTAPDGTDRKPVTQTVAINVPTPPETAATGGGTFDAPPRDPWLWQRAATFTGPPTEQDLLEINAVFTRFCQAFVNKNVEEVLSVFAAGSTIKARALGLTEEQANKNDSDALRQLFAGSGNVLAFPENAQIRTFARGVLIFPKQLDGSAHLLLIENKADPSKSNVIDYVALCKIDGKWVRVN